MLGCMFKRLSQREAYHRLIRSVPALSSMGRDCIVMSFSIRLCDAFLVRSCDLRVFLLLVGLTANEVKRSFFADG